MFCDCDRDGVARVADHAVITRADDNGAPLDGFYVCRLCAHDILTLPDGCHYINLEDGKGNIIVTYRPGEFGAITSPDPDYDH